MPLRPTMIEDLPYINEIDQALFSEIETYPVAEPIFGYYANHVVGNMPVQPQTAALIAPMNMKFFTIFRKAHVVGFMVLRNWLDQSDFSRGRYNEQDGELFYLGVGPDYRRTGLGTEALKSALIYNASRNKHRTTLARIKPGCKTFRNMLDREGFEFHPKPQNGRTIGFRYSYATLIEFPES